MLLWLACCDLPPPDPGLQRMVDQPSVRTWEAPLPGDAPPGTVPYVAELAVPRAWTVATLSDGRADFERLCAVCHGVDGTGESAVALDMALRPPPSLHEPRIVALSDREIARVIREGYGLMPRYGWRLDEVELWGVVGYVRALQLAGRVPLDALPDADRARILDILEEGS